MGVFTLGEAALRMRPDMTKFGDELQIKSTKAAKDAGEKAGDHFSKGMHDHVKSLVGGVTGILATLGVVDFLKSTNEAAQELARGSRITAGVIQSTGGAAKVTAEDIDKLSIRLSNMTGITDDVVRSGANMLLTFTNIRNEVGRNNDIFNQANKAALDVSVAFGTDITTAAVQVGKALNDPITGMQNLKRIGVSFTADQIKQAQAMEKSGNLMGAQKLILAELNKEFGNFAASAVDPAQKASVAWENFKQEIGAGVAPVVDDLANMFTKMLPTLLSIVKGTVDFVEHNKLLVKILAAVTAAMFLLDVAMDANPIGLVVLAIEALVVAFVYAWEHSKTFRNFFESIGRWFAGPFLNFFKEVGAWFSGPFVNFFLDIGHWFSGPFTAPFRATAAWFSGPFVNFFKDIGAWFAGPFLAPFKATASFFTGIWTSNFLGVRTLIEFVVRAVQIWLRVLTAEVKLVGEGVVWMYEHLWRPMWGFIVTQLRIDWVIIKGIWDLLVGYLHFIGAEVGAFIGLVVAYWRGWTKVISVEWGILRDTIFGPLTRFVTRDIPGAFATMAEAVGKHWREIRDFAFAPMRFTIEVIINKGIIDTFNTIAGFFGVKGVSHVPVPFSTGGLFRGAGGTTDDKNLIAVSDNEYIINARQTAKHLPLLHAINSGVQGFADGGLVGLLTGPARWIADKVGLGQLGGHFGDNLFVRLLAGMGQHGLDALVGKAKALIASFFTPISPAVGGVGGAVTAAVGRLSQWIAQGIAIAGVPASWASGLYTLIMRESGGNPNAINLTDSNAAAGHPSQGLMQTIPSTFAAYGLPGLGGITNPVANIVAGIRYILARYGDISRVQQANPNLPPRGYAGGGMVGGEVELGRYTIERIVQGLSARPVNVGIAGPDPWGLSVAGVTR